MLQRLVFGWTRWRDHQSAGAWSQMESGRPPDLRPRTEVEPRRAFHGDEEAVTQGLANTAFDTGRRVSSHHKGLVTGLRFTVPKPLDDRAALLDLVVGRDLEKRARLFTAIDPGKAIEVLPHPRVTVF